MYKLGMLYRHDSLYLFVTAAYSDPRIQEERELLEKVVFLTYRNAYQGYLSQ